MEKSIVAVMDNLNILGHKGGMTASIANSIFERLEELINLEDNYGLDKVRVELEALVFVASVARDAVKDKMYKEVFDETVKVVLNYIR